MAGLVPAIHALRMQTQEDMDARDKRWHDNNYIFPFNRNSAIAARAS
jgi:hypothetical protein